MLEVVSITGVVFVVIAIGFFSVRFAVFSEDDMRVFGKFVLNFALPALIFRAISGRAIGDILDIACLAAYLVASVSMFALGYVWSRKVSGQPPIAGTFNGMGMSCTNSGFFGYPILLMAIPPIASTALALGMVVENLVLIPLVLIMAERSNGGSVRGWALTKQIAGRLIRNPIVIALIAGLSVSLLGLEVPEIIAEPIRLLATASAAISLVVIGGTLSGLSLRAFNARLIPVVIGKLVLHPLAMWLGLMAAAAVGFAAADATLAKAMIILAAMPTMGIYPILAQRYGQQNDAAMAMLVMTGVSFFSISAVLWLL
jgi:malonate transporter and related proteins